MPEEKELADKLGSLFDDFKKAVDKQDEEIEKYGQATAETKQKVDRINDKISDIEAKIARLDTAPSGREGQEEENKEHKAAFGSFLRKGKDELEPEERKLLTVGDDTTGGFLAPPEFVQTITKGIIEFSPMREIARVRSTGRRSVQVPRRTGTFSAQWVSETGTRSETQGLQYGLEEVAVHEMYGLVDVSSQDIEDSVFDLEGELQTEFSEQFGVTEGSAFISGDAVGKPEGFLNNSDISTVVSGNASAITADGLFDLFYALKTGHTRNAQFVMNRSTIKEVRKLKDSNNQYLWQPSLAAGEPPTLLGAPVTEMTDMPDIAASAKPIAFGNFQRGYLIVDRVEMSVQRDPFTQATSGAVRFIARKRVGGLVMLPEAIKIQTIGT